jgi:UDP:flavonoid glycosyltransferase YjiC (YdhE family)
MTSLLLGAQVADGHVAPMLGVAHHLVDAGHRVRFLAGRRYEEQVRKTGADFLPWQGDADFDSEKRLADYEAAGGRMTGMKAIAAQIEMFFVAPAEDQFKSLSAAIAAEPTDAVLVEFGTIGGAIFALQKAPRPPVIGCGILPLGLSSADTAPFGMGMLPAPGVAARVRNRVLNTLLRHVILRRPQQHCEALIRELGGGRLDRILFDWPVYTDCYAQFTVPGFEYPRSDLPSNVKFIGPMNSVAARSHVLPEWWGDLDGQRPVVHVSQGTVANAHLDHLVLPAVQGLADQDVLVVVATAGGSIDSLGKLPPNVRVADFIPYAELMPKVDVFVTNGGYGGVHAALRSGVPIVVAGMTEDKLETSRRIQWSGVGINLQTNTPSALQVRDAVHRVLHEPSFRARAAALQGEIAVAPGVAGLERIVLDLVSRAGARTAP